MSIEATMRALAVGTRREIFLRIAEEEGLTASELSREMPITRQAIRIHLDVLQRAGLIEHERVGTSRSCYALREPLLEAVDWIGGALDANPAETS